MQLKENGYDIDENDPDQVHRVLMSLMGRQQRRAPRMLDEAECIAGSADPNPDLPSREALHYTLQTPLWEPWPEGYESIMFGMGCFWCSEDLFLRVPGVHSTQVGYTGGVTQNPTYEHVCTGKTNHNEVTRVVFDPAKVELVALLRIFWETHNPTTPFQQGNDQGTQYRSGIYYTTEGQRDLCTRSKDAYSSALAEAGIDRPISTEILPAPRFWMGEANHQQYDAKPTSSGYCGLSPLGVKLPEF